MPQIKSFSISSERLTYSFETTVLPLLSRMWNLEALHLSLNVHLPSGFMDKTYLQRYVFPLMPKLQRFGCFIHSYRFHWNDSTDLPMTENAKIIPMDVAGATIFSYADRFPEAKETDYHLYFSPCLTEYFSGISNAFPGGIFRSVRKVSLYDEKPFDHQFFLRN